jgi:hypothetical protein
MLRCRVLLHRVLLHRVLLHRAALFPVQRLRLPLCLLSVRPGFGRGALGNGPCAPPRRGAPPGSHRTRPGSSGSCP